MEREFHVINLAMTVMTFPLFFLALRIQLKSIKMAFHF